MRRLAFNKVFDIFNKNGCLLLDKEYKGNRIKLKFICKCGRTYAKTLDSFTKHPNCRKCGHGNASRNRTYTQAEVAKVFASRGCVLLGEYKACRTPVSYKCACGAMSSISFDNFKRGRRCKRCKVRKISGEGHGRWVKNRERLRLNKLFRAKCYKALSSALKAIDQSKKQKTFEILGYSPKDLQEHVSKHPNWEFVKDYKWHLDHIFPIKAFVDQGISDVKLINCLENLQPVIWKENLRKSSAYSKIDFEKWLSERTNLNVTH